MISYYYRILEVNPDATQEEIRRSYRRLAKRWHPDVNTSPEANEKFILIQKAWKTLGDPELRRNYDFYVKRYSHYSGEPAKNRPYQYPPYRPKTPTVTYSRRYWPMGPPTATPEEEAKPYYKEWVFIGFIIAFFLTLPFSSKLWFNALLKFRHNDTIAEVVDMTEGLSYFFYGNDQPVTDHVSVDLKMIDNETVIKNGMPVQRGDKFRVIYLPKYPHINKINLEMPDEETYDRYCMAIWNRWLQSEQLDELSGGSMRAVFLFALCDSVFVHYGTSGLADLYFANTPPSVNRHSNSATFSGLRKEERFAGFVEGIKGLVNP